MKQFTLTLAAGAMLALFGCSSADTHKEETAPAKDSAVATAPEAVQEETPMDSATMMKAWEAYMTPGDMHKWMASTDGKWDAEVTSWMDPGKPPMTSKSSVENKTVMGGRYQESVYKGKMMGMDFEGHGLMAYDNAKKKFVSTWIDNMGTGIMMMEGTYDEASKTVNMSGKMTDVTGKDLAMREVVKIIDDKHQTMEMYCTQGGKEFKNMEMVLTKK